MTVRSLPSVRPGARTRRCALLPGLAGFAVACAGPAANRAPPATDALLEAATASGFERTAVRAGGFDLLALRRGAGRPGFVVVYIEGDGRAWASRRRPSTDPTPANPIALRLALRDRSPAVLYVARPCQYLDRAERAACAPRYWLHERYSGAVIDAISKAVSAVLGTDSRRPTGRTPAGIGLVGFSGGGTVAALISARRDDVRWLVTVAANLDHAAWTRGHGIAPLEGSLNPVADAPRLARLPQLHLAGERDRIVPYSTLASYLDALGNPPSARVEVVPAFDHQCCWERIWPGRLDAFRSQVAAQTGRSAPSPGG